MSGEHPVFVYHNQEQLLTLVAQSKADGLSEFNNWYSNNISALISLFPNISDPTPEKYVMEAFRYRNQQSVKSALTTLEFFGMKFIEGTYSTKQSQSILSYSSSQFTSQIQKPNNLYSTISSVKVNSRVKRSLSQYYGRFREELSNNPLHKYVSVIDLFDPSKFEQGQRAELSGVKTMYEELLKVLSPDMSVMGRLQLFFQNPSLVLKQIKFCTT
jgi:hypothetical protein